MEPVVTEFEGPEEIVRRFEELKLVTDDPTIVSEIDRIIVEVEAGKMTEAIEKFTNFCSVGEKIT